MIRPARQWSAGRRGLTLIEIMIALAIGALIAMVSLGAVNSVTDANLRSASVQLTGAIKFSYDRAIMQNRIQRLVMDMDAGKWWLEYTTDPFKISEQRVEGNVGRKKNEEGTYDDADERDSLWRELGIDDRTDTEVRKALEGGRASAFKVDEEGKPRKLPGNVRFARVWTGHQEEPFEEGTAFLHFFKGGWTEPAQIELRDEDDDVITLVVYPLTGRVRSYHEALDDPDVEEVDGFEEGDE